MTTLTSTTMTMTTTVPALRLGITRGMRPGAARRRVLQRILGEIDRTAAASRADFARAGVRVVNLMSSPGAGKTTLLRETLIGLRGSMRVGIIEGGIETALDAERLAGLGAPVSLVNTADGFDGECHLDHTCRPRPEA